MFCPDCGKPIEDYDVFCTSCGKSIIEMPGEATEVAGDVVLGAPAQPTSIKKHLSKKAKLAILLSTIAFFLIVGGVVGYLIWSNPVNQFKSKLAAGELRAALEIYDDQIAGDQASETQVQDYLVALAADVATQFDQKSLTYEQADEQLTNIELLDIDFSGAVSDAKKHIDDLQISREAFAEAESLLAKKKYAEAIVQYLKVIKSDADYTTATAQLAVATKAYREAVLDDAGTLIADSEFEQALEALDAALEILPDDDALQAMRDDCQSRLNASIRAAALAEAETFWGQDEFKRALDTLTSALRIIPEDTVLQATLDGYKTQVVDNAIATADAQVASSNFSAATGAIDAALLVLPENETLLAKKQAIAAAEAAARPRVVDYSGKLSASEIADLTSQLNEMSSFFDLDFAFVIATNTEGKTSQQYADDFYDAKGYGFRDTKDGALLLLDLDNSMVYITTTGSAISSISGISLDNIINATVTAYSYNNYYPLGKAFIDQTYVELWPGD